MFDTVLVADRGVMARRVVRTCQRLGARAVTVHSAADTDAPHAVEADESLLLGATDPAASYLDGRKVLEAAGQCAAQAIHPGAGALATNAAFAASVRDAGLAWVGPPPAVLAAAHGRATATAPGGVAGRRLAVQLLGLDGGAVVAVADLERRDGLVECPAPGLSGAVRAELHAAAIAAGEGVGLLGPATVELALDAATQQPVVVSVAAHLGLDHPVVELVAGVDLVEQQLLLASGTPTTRDDQQAALRGVALQVELRVRAPGMLTTWQPAAGDGVRVESGCSQGAPTSPYDDLLATLAVWATDRDAAHERLRAARAACLVGGVDLRGQP